MVGAYFGSNAFFVASLLERYLSGAFSQPHLDFYDRYYCGLYPVYHSTITDG